MTLFDRLAIPRRLYAMSLLRVGIASVTALLYLMHVQQRHFLWGARGEVDFSYYAAYCHPTPLTLYALSGSEAWVETLFFVGLAVSVAFALGIFPRVMSLAFLMTTASLYDRNYVSLDGGQNIIILMAIYLCLVDSGAHLSLSRDWALSRQANQKCARLLPFANVVHNAGVLMIAGQICVLYFWSGFYKVGGHKWQDGTAIYYVMRTNEFQWPMFSHLIYENAYLVLILTYSTLVFQQIFPVLMWLPRVKPYLFLMAVGFHIGIALFMGLTMFSLTMIIADLAIFSDSFYRTAGARTERVVGRVIRRVLRLGRPFPAIGAK